LNRPLVEPNVPALKIPHKGGKEVLMLGTCTRKKVTVWAKRLAIRVMDINSGHRLFLHVPALTSRGRLNGGL
jgi:hypothetical protein